MVGKRRRGGEDPSPDPHGVQVGEIPSFSILA